MHSNGDQGGGGGAGSDVPPVCSSGADSPCTLCHSVVPAPVTLRFQEEPAESGSGDQPHVPMSHEKAFPVAFHVSLPAFLLRVPLLLLSSRSTISAPFLPSFISHLSCRPNVCPLFFRRPLLECLWMQMLFPTPTLCVAIGCSAAKGRTECNALGTQWHTVSLTYLN